MSSKLLGTVSVICLSTYWVIFFLSWPKLGVAFLPNPLPKIALLTGVSVLLSLRATVTGTKLWSVVTLMGGLSFVLGVILEFGL